MSAHKLDKLSLQNLDQLIGIELLTLDLLKTWVLNPNFRVGKCPFPPLRTPWLF